MDDQKFGTRNKRGDSAPNETLECAPVFVWPPRPVSLQRARRKFMETPDDRKVPATFGPIDNSLPLILLAAEIRNCCPNTAAKVSRASAESADSCQSERITPRSALSVGRGGKGKIHQGLDFLSRGSGNDPAKFGFTLQRDKCGPARDFEGL